MNEGSDPTDPNTVSPTTCLFSSSQITFSLFLQQAKLMPTSAHFLLCGMLSTNHSTPGTLTANLKPACLFTSPPVHCPPYH